MLGILSGGGNLPRLLAQAHAPNPLLMLAYHGITQPQCPQGFPHVWLHLGEVGRSIKALKAHGVQTLVLVGHFSRPSLRDLKTDLKGIQLLARLGRLWRGDNTMLLTLQAFLKDEGFCIKSPQDILPHWMAKEGPLGDVRPDEEALQVLKQGFLHLDHLSSLDCGQGIAMQQGWILGIEAAEGTDACIRRCGAMQWPTGPRALYIKGAKKGQSEALDLPTIGPNTLTNLEEAHFQGIAFEAEKTLLLHPKKLADQANKAGIFLWGEKGHP